MEDIKEISGYIYKEEGLSCGKKYLLPTIKKILAEQEKQFQDKRCFDLGCGNGSVGNFLYDLGWQVTGVDPSGEGIEIAQKTYPHLKLEQGSAYEDLPKKYGTFPLLVSLEVVEHVYAPRKYMRSAFDLVESGGLAIFSTPYHGYLKNLALSITGKMDQHFTALWDHGHIKFWSIKTLTELVNEAGFTDIEFYRVGRIPQLAKSMIALARKP